MAKEKICGIYKITNKVNGKCYIGQSVNIYKRWEYYKYRCKDSTPILSAIRKYGVDSFVFEIIEKCEIANINEREIYWIATLSSCAPYGYNLSTGGRNTTWVYKPSVETLKKRSIALTGKKRTAETKLKMSEAQKGKNLSDAHKEALRKSNIGRPSSNKGKPMTDAVKAKMIASKLGKPATWRMRPVIRSDGEMFQSVTIAAKAINAHKATIHKNLQGKLKTVHGFTFKYGGVPLQQ